MRETEIGKSNVEGFGAVVLSSFDGIGNGDVVLFYWLFVFILCLETLKNIKQFRFGCHARGHSCKWSCSGSCALPTEQTRERLVIFFKVCFFSKKVLK